MGQLHTVRLAIMKRLRASPYSRLLAVVVSASAGIITGNLVVQGTVSDAEAPGSVIATLALVCVFGLASWCAKGTARQSGRR
jgi:hypothetical protein